MRKSQEDSDLYKKSFKLNQLLGACLNRKHEPSSRLITVTRKGLKTQDVLLDVGPTKLTIGDLWTLIPPDIARKHSSKTLFITNLSWLALNPVPRLFVQGSRPWLELVMCHADFVY